MQILRSGIQLPEGGDNVTRQNDSANLVILDALVREDYREKVDIASLDAAAKIYTTVDYLRPENGTKYLRCVLSNKNASGYYTTDTWQFYDAAGAVVIKNITWTLTYDASGNVVDKVPVVA